ncbi:LOB domain-containing protein 28 [Raphanus sativus]|uniref:LOB domain-containing protein 28 n=1 Tax=Raphanus sativus TaxID=3726 RepID=A0A6J0MAL9_RAPSA|nr:LOB domain-containing protein 28 [Raphanus sativus]XP_056848653.1 LOB domain-containing protein 28 [Raphanus sativus]XP_056848657.1 LOB domain-containing protein 28 [Raphanus sativus]KAJ4910598.1 LOB domain-containing protein 28 [Raphanus sativus]
MTTPCAACKYLRRKCTQACVFAPYFPPNKQEDYTAIHKVFGASQVAKILNDLHPSQRQDAVTSLVYEAQTLLLDPVHGCSLQICNLQRQLKDLQDQVQIARNDLASYNNIVPSLDLQDQVQIARNDLAPYNNIVPPLDLQDQVQIARNDLAPYNNIVPPLDLPPPITYQQNIHNPMLMPVVSNYGGQLTSQQLNEEAHRVESEKSAQVKQMQQNAAQSKRDDCP